MSSSAVVIGALTLSTLGKIFSRKHAEIFFLFFPYNLVLMFHVNCLSGDSLIEMSSPFFCEK